MSALSGLNLFNFAHSYYHMWEIADNALVDVSFKKQILFDYITIYILITGSS